MVCHTQAANKPPRTCRSSNRRIGLYVHVFREPNSLADRLANKARQFGNCCCVENVEICKNLIFHMDGSHTEASTGLGVILHGHNLDTWHDELPESNSTLICWVGLKMRHSSACEAETAAIVISLVLAAAYRQTVLFNDLTHLRATMQQIVSVHELSYDMLVPLLSKHC